MLINLRRAAAAAFTTRRIDLGPSELELGRAQLGLARLSRGYRQSESPRVQVPIYLVARGPEPNSTVAT